MDYKDTLNLPQTDFPMRGNLPQREPEILAKWEKNKIYEKVQKARADGKCLSCTTVLPMPMGIFIWPCSKQGAERHYYPL